MVAIVLALLGPVSAAALASWPDYRDKPDAWYRGEEGVRITKNVLSWQSPRGSWPKNTDTMTTAFTGSPETLRGTFDNGATVDELRFLARALHAATDADLRRNCEQGFSKGLDHILEAQYPNGGWPQDFPPHSGYARHITFNDGAMVRLMNFLREVAASPDYAFVDATRRAAARGAVERGIECILKCQIVVDGKRTAWCAQHDAADYSPRPARSYELVSISGGESVGILQFLMSLEEPSAQVVEAVNAGVAWFESVKLTGIRQTVVDGDKKIVPDPDAPPLWARFYEIGTNRPIFSGRDGIKKYSLSEIEAERRNGYAWYGTWPRNLASEHAAWREERPAQRDSSGRDARQPSPEREASK